MLDIHLNDETRATEAWKVLVAERVPNVYILVDGVNNWLAIFAADQDRIKPLQAFGRRDCRFRN